MKQAFISTLFLTLSLVFSPFSKAITEKNYQQDYLFTVLPFLKSGESFNFQSADGKLSLSAIRFIHPQEKGLIVVINGQSEAWLKYAEVFYDFYQKGYSIYSYDHRGQGLSPHLVANNSQIGHVDHFTQYSDDMNEFMDKVIKPVHPSSKNLFLIAHSMGGGISAEYLERFTSPFQAVVLSAPMLGINTKPYPEKIARAIVSVSKTFGFGKKYAIGQHDYHCEGSFESNKVTTSKARWWMNTYACKTSPDTIIGGPSNGWINESLRETKRIRKEIGQIKTNVLLFQAEFDQYVINEYEDAACSQMQNCHLSIFHNSQHEILMEQDSIRDSALQQILNFFSQSK